MLNCTANSQAKKTAGIAQTYRAGENEIYATCPDTCVLKPYETGTTEIDREYESAVRRAVPRRGVSFLFTHFKPELWAEKNEPGKTVFNFSAQTLGESALYVKKGIASVAVVPASFWNDRKSKKVTTVNGVKMVRCPDETTKIGCARCGNGVPLCARMDRPFGIVFTAHGASKRKAGDNAERGGCYAGGGNVGYHWRNLSKRDQTESDSAKITKFVKSLIPGSIFRPHVAGDLGRVNVSGPDTVK
jgi:hypothetical protein